MMFSFGSSTAFVSTAALSADAITEPASTTAGLIAQIGGIAALGTLGAFLLNRSDRREDGAASTARADLEAERRAHEETRKALLESLKSRKDDRP